MRLLHGFLAVTFVVHAAAFTMLAVKRRKRYYFALTGTFVFLTAVYVLKFREISLVFPGTDLSLTLVFRIMAIGCTTGYLALIAKIPGTWLSRLIGRG